MICRETQTVNLLLSAAFAILLVMSEVGCATFSHHGGDGEVSAHDQVVIQEASPPANDLTDSGADLKAIPIEINRLVLQWIDYFQGPGRPHMERYLSRSTRYMPVMRGILKKEGLPEDLIYIALIESGFSSSAKSSAKAVGYWQFIRGTGHRYGLQIDSYVDDRRDFIKSTQAAADYFKGLYNLFGAWYLAIASYNVGENRVKNVVMKYHTRDFWQLARENKLPAETINYVPKFLAARLIAKEPEKYGFTDIDYLPPLEFSEATFKTGIDLRKLAKEMNIEYDDLRDLNPAYKRGVALSKSGHLTLRVPKGAEALAIAAGPNATAGSVKAYVADEDFGYYRVRRGDTISMIAHKFSTSTKRIRQLNRGNSMLIAGRRIRVPGETIGDVSGEEESSSGVSAIGGSKKKTLARNRLPANQRQAKASSQLPSQGSSGADRKVHIVRKGESLIEIARKYQVPLRQLAQYNGINRRAMIQVGTRLEIP